MQKILDIILMKFVNDGSYRTIMTILLLFTVVFAINIDRKTSAEITELCLQLKTTNASQIRLVANESNAQYDMLIKSLEHLSTNMIDYARSSQTADDYQNEQSLKNMTKMFEQHIELIKQYKEANLKYYNSLIYGTNEPMKQLNTQQAKQ